jgi:MFS family permease
MQAFRSLNHRPFAFLWSGQTVSRLGDALYQLALSWWVLEKTGSATTMGMVLVFSFAPSILLAILGGVIVDRLPRFRIMLVSDLVRGLIVALVAVLAFYDRLEVWHIYIASLLFGIVDAFFFPAYTAAVPEIVEKEMLPSANSLTGASQPIAGMVGPILAAFLIASGGTPLAFLLDAASFFFSALLLLPLLKLEPPIPAASARQVGEEIRSGIRIVMGSAWIWLTILLSSVGNITRGGPIQVTLPFIVEGTLKADVHALGWVRAAMLLGSLLVALLGAQLQKAPRRGLLAYGSMILAGFMTLWIGLAHTIAELLVAGFLIGACTSVFTLIWIATLQEQVPQDKLGRVSSIDYLGSFVFIPIGFAATGWFTDLINPPTVFIVGGILTILIWVIGLLNKSVRNLD